VQEHFEFRKRSAIAALVTPGVARRETALSSMILMTAVEGSVSTAVLAEGQHPRSTPASTNRHSMQQRLDFRLPSWL